MIDLLKKIQNIKINAKSLANNNIHEILAGIVAFFSIAYIIVVNPTILSSINNLAGTVSSNQMAVQLNNNGMTFDFVMIGTCLAAGISCIVVGLFAKSPYILAPGMGLNTLFVFNLVKEYNLPWQVALGVVFLSGLLIVLVTLCGLGKIIIHQIPKDLKMAIGTGIGALIVVLGLKNSGIILVSDHSSIIQLGNFANHHACLTLIGVILIAAMIYRGARFAILLGMLQIILLEILYCLFADMPYIYSKHHYSQIYHALNANITRFFNYFTTIPSELLITPQVIGNYFSSLFLQLNIVDALTISLIAPILSLFLIDYLDSVVALIVLNRKLNRVNIYNENSKIKTISNALNEQNNLNDNKQYFNNKINQENTNSQQIDVQDKKILLVDGAATMIGAICGTSNTTICIESASGIDSGGKTQIVSITAGICFLLAIFILPIIKLIPTSVTSAIMIIIGILMCSELNKINWNKINIALPAFLALFVTPLTNSIINGIGICSICYTFLSLLCKDRKHISPIMYIMTIGFMIYFFR